MHSAAPGVISPCRWTISCLSSRATRTANSDRKFEIECTLLPLTAHAATILGQRCVVHRRAARPRPTPTLPGPQRLILTGPGPGRSGRLMTWVGASASRGAPRPGQVPDVDHPDEIAVVEHGQVPEPAGDHGLRCVTEARRRSAEGQIAGHQVPDADVVHVLTVGN